MLETKPGSKFFWTKEPGIPHRCLTCRAGADGIRDFLDWGFNFDYYGDVVICAACLREMAEATGYVPVADLNAVNDEVVDLQKKLEKEQNDALQLVNALNALRGLPPTVIDPTMESENSGETSEGRNEGSEGSEQQFDESNSSRGSSVIPGFGDSTDLI